MENFINDFRIYCENVEDTKGLEIIKENIISSFYNLETVIDDYCELEIDSIGSQIIEGERLINILQLLIPRAKKIESLHIKEIWKAFEIAQVNNKYQIKEIIEASVISSCEYLYEKYGATKGFLIVRDLKDEEIEKWYKDLCELEEKYFE